MKRSPFLCLALLPILACGGSKPEPETPADAPAGRVASVAPTPSGSSAVAAKPDEKEDMTPVHWKNFPGPKVKVDVKGATDAWVALPTGPEVSFESFVDINVGHVIRAEANELVVETFAGHREVFVPGLFVHPMVKATGLTKGTVVLVGAGGGTTYARVESTSGDQVKVRYDWGGQSSGTEEPSERVIKVEEKVTWGARVMDGDNQPLKVLASDREKTWVVTLFGIPSQVDTSTLKPMKIAKVLKKGDKVLAGTQSLEPGVVTEAIDGGTAYKVKLDGGKEERFAFADVTTP